MIRGSSITLRMVAPIPYDRIGRGQIRKDERMSNSDEIFDRMRIAFRENLSVRTEAATAKLEGEPPKSYEELMDQMRESYFSGIMDYADCILAAVSEEIAMLQRQDPPSPPYKT